MGAFAWPSASDGKVFLTQAQLADGLLEGIDWRQPKAAADTPLTIAVKSLYPGCHR
ncbi:transposase [Escherichia coli]|nr:transposase [Escherichia coli]